jgi:hypothetical protein
MLASARLFALVFLTLLVPCEASLAQTTAQTASKWGLLGNWKLDCSAPASSSNGNLAYAVRGGKLFHDRDFGDRKDSSPVTLATKKPDGSLELVIHFVGLKQTRQFLLMKGSDGRLRALSNRNADTNEYTIVGGKFTANGDETPWQTRCR